MRRVKSRNFILVVCGILIFMLLSFVIAKTMISLIDDVSIKDKEKEMYQNIISSSSKIKLNGSGNFIGNTPKLSKTIISDFNILVKKKDDEVKYTVGFCNMNDDEVIYNKILLEGISCYDEENEISCDNVKIDKYLRNRKDVFSREELISPNSCVDMVVDVKYTSNEEKNTYVYIDKIALELGVK